ncbi:MAG: TetR/AcrR family transcriptional regulator [Dokdonella sp.]
MARKRLNREESREQTRQALLAAAAKVIAKRGVGGTSVELVAAEAGYTRGAFYSNFKGKDDLFIELLRHDHAQMMQTFYELFVDGADLDALSQRLRSLYGQIFRNNDHCLLWMEARLHAVRHATFRTRLNQLINENRQHITHFIERYHALTGKPPVLPPRELAIGLMALAESIKFAHMVDPHEVDDGVANRVLEVFFEAVTTMGATPQSHP